MFSHWKYTAISVYFIQLSLVWTGKFTLEIFFLDYYVF